MANRPNDEVSPQNAAGWRAIQQSPQPEMFSMPSSNRQSQSPDSIRVRNSALATYLDTQRPMPLYRAQELSPGQSKTQIQDQWGRLIDQPTPSELTLLHEAYGSAEILMKETLAAWAPFFATADEARDYYREGGVHDDLKPAALALFNRAWELSVEGDKETLLTGDLNAKSNEALPYPSEQDQVAALEAEAIDVGVPQPATYDPDLPQSAVPMPDDQVSIGDVHKIIAESQSDETD